MDHVTLRDMQASDLAEVHAIEASSFSSPWSEQSISAEIAGSQSIKLVAVDDGTVVGYAMARLVLDEGQLLDIAVHANYRRTGIADMLLRGLVQRLKQRGCKVLYLEVRASNGPAMGLYKKYGFEAVSRRKDYYRHPVEDALIMKKAVE